MKKKEDFLYLLIKSMSRSEKRFFKLQTNLFSHAKKTNYLSLFNIIDKLDQYDDALIKKQTQELTDIKYLHQLKKYLKEQLLTSLRLFHKKNVPTIKMLDNIGFALSLRERNFSKEAKKILQDQKKEYQEKHTHTVPFIILEQLCQIKELEEPSIKNLETMAKYYKEQVEHLENEKCLFQLQAISSKVGYIVNSKQRILNQSKALKKILAEDIGQITLLSLKTDNQKYVYYNLLSNIYLNLQEEEHYALAIEQLYKLSRTKSFQYNTVIPIQIRINLLRVCILKNNPTRFFKILEELESLIRSHKKSSTFIYWKYYRLLGFYYHFDEPKPSKQFFKEIELLINDEQNGISKEAKNSLKISVAKFLFKEKHYLKAQETLVPILILAPLPIDFPEYLTANLLNIICSYELQAFDIVDKEIRSIRRKLQRKKLIDNHTIELFKLLTQLNNAKDNSQKKKAQQKKINTFIDKQLISNNFVYKKDLDFLHKWIKASTN